MTVEALVALAAKLPRSERVRLITLLQDLMRSSEQASRREARVDYGALLELAGAFHSRSSDDLEDALDASSGGEC